MIVHVGFWQDALTWLLPSTTKRFFTSCDCWNWLSTEVFGSAPMRAVPSSWIDQPSVSRPLRTDEDLDAGRLEHLLRGVRHVLGHLLFVVAERVVEAQDRHSPPILHLRIEIDGVLVPRQHLAEAAHVDEGAGVVAHLFLEARAEAGRRRRRCRGTCRVPLPPSKP